MSRIAVDLSGQIFGRLRVLRPVIRHRKTHWECICECGRTKAVMSSNLKTGMTQSCGCLQRERAAAAQHRHGYTRRGHKAPEYVAWANIIGRCENPNDGHFHLYGARGIHICREWRASFTAFLRDVGRRPSPRHSLDRIDNDGPYSPENCRWTTQKHQCNNTRRSHRVTFKGETHTVTQWAEIVGVQRQTLAHRLRHGWAPDKALTVPVRR